MIHFEWFQSMKHADYVGVAPEVERQLQWYDSLMGDPLPDLPEWTVPLLVQYLGEKGKMVPKPIGDSPSSGKLRLISGRAADALSDIWDKQAELYPVDLDDSNESYFMVIPKMALPFDALDRKRSVGKPVKYGPNADKGYFAVLEEWVFNDEIVNDKDLFTIPDSCTTIYVSERFKSKVIESGLNGFCLKTSFWEDSPFIS